MQRVLETLAPGVTNSQMTVVNLGSNQSTQAYNAAFSSFSLSGLSGMGWNWVNINGAIDIAAFFDGTGTYNINNTGIIQIDSGSSNVTGGISTDELAVVNTNATVLDNFLGNGGALHSLAEDTGGQYGWLGTLLPGLTFNTFQDQGLFLTADGQSAFPGLTNSDLSAGPFHGTWTGGLGGLTTLFTNSNGNAVGIGSGGGSVTNPEPPSTGVPEPSGFILFGAGLVAIRLAMKRRRHLA
ncbi:PEP-CTERM sorting domain-containing protein [Salinisphaera sp. T31B1]|uniref:PEP-CTERM sorting domain-containing protein n=1 Tax=Salinisphaera sp. T31B1 TaxID=727963 RepID=UPI00333F57B6